MKIRPAGAELFHVDGLTGRQTDKRTGMTKLTVAFHNFVNAPKTSQLMLYTEIFAVCSQIHTKHIITLCGQNVGLLNVDLWYL